MALCAPRASGLAGVAPGVTGGSWPRGTCLLRAHVPGSKQLNRPTCPSRAAFRRTVSPRAVLGRPGSCPGPKTLFPTRRSFRGGRSLGTPTPDLPTPGRRPAGVWGLPPRPSRVGRCPAARAKSGLSGGSFHAREFSFLSVPEPPAPFFRGALNNLPTRPRLGGGRGARVRTHSSWPLSHPVRLTLFPS